MSTTQKVIDVNPEDCSQIHTDVASDNGTAKQIDSKENMLKEIQKRKEFDAHGFNFESTRICSKTLTSNIENKIRKQKGKSVSYRTPSKSKHAKKLDKNINFETRDLFKRMQKSIDDISDEEIAAILEKGDSEPAPVFSSSKSENLYNILFEERDVLCRLMLASEKESIRKAYKDYSILWNVLAGRINDCCIPKHLFERHSEILSWLPGGTTTLDVKINKLHVLLASVVLSTLNSFSLLPALAGRSLKTITADSNVAVEEAINKHFSSIPYIYEQITLWEHPEWKQHLADKICQAVFSIIPADRNKTEISRDAMNEISKKLLEIIDAIHNDFIKISFSDNKKLMRTAETSNILKFFIVDKLVSDTNTKDEIKAKYSLYEDFTKDFIFLIHSNTAYPQTSEELMQIVKTGMFVCPSNTMLAETAETVTRILEKTYHKDTFLFLADMESNVKFTMEQLRKTYPNNTLEAGKEKIDHG